MKIIEYIQLNIKFDWISNMLKNNNIFSILESSAKPKKYKFVTTFFISNPKVLMIRNCIQSTDIPCTCISIDVAKKTLEDEIPIGVFWFVLDGNVVCYDPENDATFTPDDDSVFYIIESDQHMGQFLCKKFPIVSRLRSIIRDSKLIELDKSDKSNQYDHFYYMKYPDLAIVIHENESYIQVFAIKHGKILEHCSIKGTLDSIRIPIRQIKIAGINQYYLVSF